MSAVDPATLLTSWDGQQAAYIADREARFRIMVEVLRLACGDAPLVVDLACGPGSLSTRALDALPQATVLAVDHDPLLLDIATRALRPAHGDRFTTLDADLADESWPELVADALGGRTPNAFISTTALHWLTPDALVRVYAGAAALLGGGESCSTVTISASTAETRCCGAWRPRMTTKRSGVPTRPVRRPGKRGGTRRGHSPDRLPSPRFVTPASPTGPLHRPPRWTFTSRHSRRPASPKSARCGSCSTTTSCSA